MVTVATFNDSGAAGGGGETNYTRSSSSSAREHDRFLPIANVSRIMKKGLPGNAKISKDAKETVQECVSEFISFITGEASDKCRREKRKTINGDDLLWAMTTLGFKVYVEPLKIYLDKFREMEGEKTAGTGMARQLLHADHHPHEYHDQRQREQLQHLHAPGMNMYGGMMIDGSSTSSSSSRSRASSLSLWIW